MICLLRQVHFMQMSSRSFTDGLPVVFLSLLSSSADPAQLISNKHDNIHIPWGDILSITHTKNRRYFNTNRTKNFTSTVTIARDQNLLIIAMKIKGHLKSVGFSTPMPVTVFSSKSSTILDA